MVLKEIRFEIPPLLLFENPKRKRKKIKRKIKRRK